MSGVGSGDYIDELKRVSNVIIIGGGDQDLESKLAKAHRAGMKIMISTRWVFFDGKGAIYDEPFLTANWVGLKKALKPYRGDILGFYLADEPFWTYYSAQAPADRHMDWMRDWLNFLSKKIKTDPEWSDFKPKTAFIEAAPIIRDKLFLNPSEVDWIGVDCYDGFDSCLGMSIPAYFAAIPLNKGQRLIAVPGVGRPASLTARTEKKLLDDLELFDAMIAKDRRFIMTMPFLWQSFDSEGGWTGARDLPVVRRELERRGRP
jgi:hypothetical protein